MRILFINTAAQMSVSDVARGYKAALTRAGHDVYEYNMRARFDYHAKAIPPEAQKDPTLVSKHASETIVCEAMYHRADLVIIISGLNVHPIALWLLGKVGIPAAVILTESPYDDGPQKTWVSTAEEFDAPLDLTVFTNDRYSAQNTKTCGRQWICLPPAFDPAVHRPADPDPDTACDVIMVGSGWGERQAMLEAVDWTDIKLRIYGIWPGLENNTDSPIFKYFKPLVVNNQIISGVYNSAKVCINMHRRSPLALTYGPRVVETAACGAFQISDKRSDMGKLFGASIPTFKTVAEFEQLVRYYIDPANDTERLHLSHMAREAVRDQTFDSRVASLMAALPLSVRDKLEPQQLAV